MPPYSQRGTADHVLCRNTHNFPTRRSSKLTLATKLLHFHTHRQQTSNLQVTGTRFRALQASVFAAGHRRPRALQKHNQWDQCCRVQTHFSIKTSSFSHTQTTNKQLTSHRYSFSGITCLRILSGAPPTTSSAETHTISLLDALPNSL